VAPPLVVLSGRIELDCGGQKLVATVRGGEATVTLSEDWEAQVYEFGSEQPVRKIRERMTLRLEIEASLDEMTVQIDPAP
jgi:hypothetical protein